jgi:acyl-CoA synthetase (NDP forming)
MKCLLADPNIDSLIVIYIPPLITDPNEIAAAIAEGAGSQGDKTVLTVFMSTSETPRALERIPSYAFPEAAATALARVTTYGKWKARPTGRLVEFASFDKPAAQGVVERAVAQGSSWLSPTELRDLAGACGIPLARSQEAQGLNEAVRAAEEIGFPVAMKAIGSTIVHKTEVGGVKLGLADVAAVRAAYSDLHERLGSRLEAVSVQEMVTSGVEVMVGSLQDPLFGPLVLYGSGGTLVEIMADVALRLHPLTDQDARDMLEEVKGTALLRGFRGAARGDEAALRELLLRVSALLEACPEIAEMDLNPVKVLERGVVAVDCRVRVARKTAALPSRRIAY